MTKKIPLFILTLLTDLCIGLVYGWSVFVAPLEAEFGWERSQTSLTFTISIMAMCIGIMAGGRFNNHRNRPFISMIIAAALMFVGFAVVSRAHTLIIFYIFYGIISTQLMFAALIGPFAAGKLYTATGSYVTTFYGIIGLGILAIVLAFAVIRLAGKKNRKLDR